MRASALKDLGLRTDQLDRFEADELEEMFAAAEARKQDAIRTLAVAIWWIVHPGLAEESRAGFQPLKVARSLPGFVERPGEEEPKG